MRVSVRPAFTALPLAAAAWAAMACEGKPLTGPEAQAAYATAAREYPTLPASAVVFVNGQRMPAGQRLDQLDPKTIERIEILKGAAAAKLAGQEGRDGVIQIYTKRGSQPGAPGER